jgi:hypothetical protein
MYVASILHINTPYQIETGFPKDYVLNKLTQVDMDHKTLINKAGEINTSLSVSID